jgi:hypothetical protein
MRFLDLRDSRGPMPADRTCSSISRGTQSCKTFRLRTVRPPGLIDAEEQGNGAFAAVPVGESGCGGCIFRRCRTRQTYNTSRDGRAAPTSKGLSIYTLISPGASKHNIIECHYDAVADPKNLIWDITAVNAGWLFTRQAFNSRTLSD